MLIHVWAQLLHINSIDNDAIQTKRFNTLSSCHNIIIIQNIFFCLFESKKWQHRTKIYLLKNQTVKRSNILFLTLQQQFSLFSLEKFGYFFEYLHLSGTWFYFQFFFFLLKTRNKFFFNIFAF